MRKTPDLKDFESCKQCVAGVRTGIPDFQVKIEDAIAEGDKLARRIHDSIHTLLILPGSVFTTFAASNPLSPFPSLEFSIIFPE